MQAKFFHVDAIVWGCAESVGVEMKILWDRMYIQVSSKFICVTFICAKTISENARTHTHTAHYIFIYPVFGSLCAPQNET